METLLSSSLCLWSLGVVCLKLTWISVFLNSTFKRFVCCPRFHQGSLGDFWKRFSQANESLLVWILACARMTVSRSPIALPAGSEKLYIL